MAHTQYYSQESRDPFTAAMLSMIPGLGQFYNGESRKGMLFLDVAIINMALLSLIVTAPAITKFMQEFAPHYGMKINHAVIAALKQMQLGSPVSLLVTGMILAFVGYAARDAYDRAIAKRRQAIYKDWVVELPEATSGSYILHASLIVSLGILAMFFMIPPPAHKQITEIMFMDKVIPAPKPIVKPTVIATNNAQKESRFDPKRAIQQQPKHNEMKQHENAAIKTASENSRQAEQQQKTADSSSSGASAQAKIQPTPPKHSEAAVTKIASAIAPPTPQLSFLKNFSTANASTPVAPKLQNMATVQATVNPIPKAVSSASASAAVVVPIAMNPGQSPLPLLPIPSMMSSGTMRNSGANITPMPAGAAQGSSHGLQLPSVSAPQLGGKISGPPATPSGSSGGPGRKSNAFSSGIGPESIIRGDTTGSGPSVVPVEMRGHGRKAGPGDADGDNRGPAPVHAGRHGNSFTSGPIRLTPSVPFSGPETTDANIPGDEGKTSTPPAIKDADFTQYMMNLQRKIKRAWFPPAHSEKNRVKVLFKIHTNGEMSNLRITAASGIAAVDQAALAAVQNAAPFQHLPENAPENVDIEFSFDYNVYKGI